MPNTPLSVGAYGPAVARLQSALRQQGFVLPASEVDRSFFGPATRQAVRQFQQKKNLPVTGEVDERTASALDAITPPPQPTPSVPAQGQAKGAPSGSTAQTPGSLTLSQSTLPLGLGRVGPRVQAGGGASASAKATVPAPKFADLNGAVSDKTVLENLTSNTQARSYLNNALMGVLKTKLATMFSGTQKTNLADLVKRISSADLVAEASLSIKAFMAKKVGSAGLVDASTKQALDTEIAGLPDAKTIGDILQLNLTLHSHPLFQSYATKVNLASLLSTSPVLAQNQKLQADFIEKYSAAPRRTAVFWKELSNHPEFKAVVPELQLTVELGALTLGNSALVAAIRKQYKPISTRDLTSLSAKDWTQLITSNQIPVPRSVIGDTQAAKISSYVSALMQGLKLQFATVYIAQAIRIHPRDRYDQEVVEFLYRWEKFDLIRTNLAQFLKDNPDAQTLVNEEDYQQPFLNRLTGYQRLARIYSDSDVVTALMADGLDSAYKIASLPEAVFLRQYSQAFGGNDRTTQMPGLKDAAILTRGGTNKAKSVYDNAKHIAASTLHFFMTVCEGLAKAHPRVFGDVAKEVSDAIQQIPNWQELFGPTSYCACQDCRSVLSAAAYLADLLHFLSGRNVDPNNPTGFTLLDVLNRRRPDISNIKLNCENTNTELPYLDLVNEILECVVATAPGETPIPPGYNTPADATSDALSVNPEYTRDAAYVPLENAYYPFSLPFDRFLSIARSYLEFAGGSLYDVMKTYQMGADPVVPANSNASPYPSDETIILEYLKISPNEFLILTGQLFQGTSPLTNLNDLAAYYGYTPPFPVGGWVQDLSSVPNFLQRTGINYDDLLILATTQFINPDQTMTIQPAATTQPPDPAQICNIDNLVIVNLVPSRVDHPDYSRLREVYRFIRLASKMGWSFADLDRALTSLGTTDIDAPSLLSISKIKQLQDALKLTVSEVLGLWADLDTNGSGSLYVSLFQNKGALNPLDPGMALQYEAQLPTLPAGGLSSLDPYGAKLSWLGGNLQFSGNNGQPITPNQERYLLSLSTDPNYQDAVSQLFIQNQLTWPLQNLPAGFVLPSQLPDAIYYQQTRLSFIGEMSESMHSQLKTLKSLSDDPGYQLAIDNLYALRWSSETEIAVANQFLASQPGQLIPAQTISAHNSAICAALRISIADLAAIVSYLWSQSAPPPPTLTANSSGGSLASGVYYVKVSAVDAFGEWLYSRESDAIAVSGPNGLISVSWNPVPGATLYNIYYTVTDGGGGNETLEINSTGTSATITTTAIGGSVSTGTPPTSLAFPLNLPNLSKIYRYATLARALGRSASDLLNLIQLIGIDPFRLAAPGTLEFVTKAREVLNSKFSIAQLNFLYRNIQNPSAGLGPRQSELDQLVASLQASLSSPPAETSPATDPTGALLQNYLNTVLEPSYASQVMLLVQKSAQYGAALPLLPLIAFPPSLVGFISYGGTNLIFTGPMSNSQLSELLSLSDDSSYQAAIENLYQQGQPAWAVTYKSPPSSNQLPPVTFPSAFAGTGSGAAPFFVGSQPVISSVSPPAAPSGATVTIDGVNFGAVQGGVTLNGAAVVVSGWTDTQIQIALPATATSGNLVVDVSNATSNAVPFSIGTQPLISSVTPPSAPAGDSLTISGVNFGSVPGSVTLDGTSLIVGGWTDAQIGVTLPVGASSGNLLITVGASASNPVPFIVGTQPVISSISPPVAQPGDSVQINGANFGSTRGLSTVTLNGVAVNVKNWSDTQITASVPTGAASGNLVVTVGVLIAIDPTNTFLTFIGPMAADQEAQLLELSSDPNYQAAVQNLFQQGQPTWAAQYTARLNTLPAISIPALTSCLISVDPNVAITSTGALSDADAATLLGLSADYQYQKAIQSLYLQPRQLIVSKLFFLNTDNLIERLINDPSASVPERYGFVLNALLSCVSLVVQTVSRSLGLDVAVVRLLLVGGLDTGTPAIVKSAIDPSLAAIADFFALLGNGISASYYPGADYGGSLIQPPPPEATLDFSWNQTSVLSPGLDPSAFSAKWAGQLVGQFSETYTLEVTLSPKPLSGSVTVKGPNVAWISGAKFNTAWTGEAIYIDGSGYVVQAVGSPTSLTLASNAPTETAPVPFCVSPIVLSGQVTTAGANVTWASGVQFDPSWAGMIYVNGAAYSIQSVTSPTSLVLASSAGNQSNPVPYCVTPIVITANGAVLPLSPPPAAGSGASNSASLAAFDLLTSLDLVSGELTPIELDYPNSPGLTLSGLTLSWSSLSTAKAVIQQHQLYSSPTFAFDKPLATFDLLSRIALLVNTFHVTFADLNYLLAHPASFAGAAPNNPANVLPFDLSNLPMGPSAYSPALFNQWERFLALFALRDSLPGGDSGLLALFNAAGSGPTLSGAALISAIATATSWDTAELLTFLGYQPDPLANASIGFNLTAGDFTDERWLRRLQGCLALASRFSVSAKHMFEWASLGSNPPSEPTIARDIQAAVKARYDDSTWIKVGKALNDKLRESSRDALVTYILANSGTWELGTNLSTEDDLYQYYLIDVEMGSCMLTSRIVQATAAIQLFAQRCLMNLEQDVSPSAIDTRWNWMKNYRVWQANREVFLYPENWIDPTLRDDKTPFFIDLENELQQNPITPDNVEQAFLNYLEKVDQVARLDICGTYWQYDPFSPPRLAGAQDISNDTLHVFGRTLATPRIYFYRRLVNASTPSPLWTPWEKVDLDIQGDHLIPIVWNRRVYLFWPTFTEASSKLPRAVQGQPPWKVANIALAWSEYKQNKWTPKQVSNDVAIPQFWFSSPQPTESPVSPGLSVSPSYIESIAMYQGILDPRWITFVPTITPPGMLNINVQIDGWSDLYGIWYFYNPDLTLPPPNPLPHLPDLAPGPLPVSPQIFVFRDAGVFQLLCGGQVITSSQDPSYVWSVSPDEVPNVLLPGNSNIEYMRATQLGPSSPYYYPGLSVPFIADQSSGSPLYVNMLFVSPSLFRIVYDLGIYSASNAAFPSSATSNPPAGFFVPLTWANYATNFQPFFYQDDQRVYFVNVAPFGLQQQPSFTLDQFGSYALATFATHFHPHICAFVSTLNQYGITGLLSLLTQQRSNDGRVVSGFTLSYPSGTKNPYVGLTGGSLYAQGELYQTPTGALPAVPPIDDSVSSYQFLFSDPSGNLYYTILNWPNTPGDALIGEVETDGAGTIIGVFPTSMFTQHTIFEELYIPDVGLPYPREDVDFSYGGSYSIYNWELFFHIPLLIAARLSQNQQFEEAQKWFHYIFNPTTNSSDPVPERFWSFLPFYRCSASDEINNSIESLLLQLDNLTPIPQPSECGLDAMSQVAAWTDDPFNPFLIARMRTIAFRKNVVMKYIDNLIAWGDYLFRQNTRESINEAIQIYVLAQEILGGRPVAIPPPGAIMDYSYNDLAAQGTVDGFTNELVALETAFPFNTGNSISGAGGNGTGNLNGTAQTFYFCVPANDQLIAYWDTVDDRLYKIRHCMNIQGQVEQLALFAPPINPALLVQAAAAGVDLSSVLNDVNAPSPNYRFNFMFQKALELCAEVIALGASLLSALEKSDAEALSVLRSTQEISLLQAVLQIKQSQIDEANKNVAGLQGSYAVTANRQTYYQQLINSGQTSFETTQISELRQAQQFQFASQVVDSVAAAVAMIPEFNFGEAGAMGSPVVTFSFGGSNLAKYYEMVSSGLRAVAGIHSYNANMASIMGGWDRRSQDWGFQLNTATKELGQIQSQIDAANVRVQIGQTDLQNQQLQITNSQAALDFLKSKYTNQDLYGWMISQISATYFQCYQMAYGLAKRAEACLRLDLGLPASNFIQFGYWDSLRKGLQAGEGLYADLKRMEIGYLDQNQRKYEISKYISLVMFDPLALIALKETGQCFVSLPEALFDMDYPGQYLRQIQSLSITMPCVTGPYTSVNCKLTLVSSKIRVDNVANGPDDYVQDSHFMTNLAATQSIVTSSGQNDSGLFELNFRDERYLPFEGAGVISNWLIELPPDCNVFDFETISDVVINLKYTARDGGDALRAAAKQAATLPGPADQASVGVNGVSFPSQNNLIRFFSLRHEFPTEWYKFVNPLPADTAQTMLLPLIMERFPFQYRGKTIVVSEVDLLLKFKDIYDTHRFKTGTPLGDFVNAQGTPGRLNVYVTQAPSHMTQATQPPMQPPQGSKPISLTSNPATLNGSPYGSSASPLSLNLGSWWLQVFIASNYMGSVAATLLDSNNHLISSLIENVFMVCRYSAT
jgi:peptidoglycan hydrolase-like protein with peptidoglycan-binding domain